MKRSRAVSTQNSKGVEFLFKKNKITWIKGTARSGGGKSVGRVKARTERRKSTTRKKAIVISTGSRVKGLPQIGLELNKTTRDLVRRSADPREGAQVDRSSSAPAPSAASSPTSSTPSARRSRSLEVLPTILPLEDADCSAEVARSFKKRKIDVITGAKISNVKVGKDSVKMTRRSGRREAGARGREGARRRGARA